MDYGASAARSNGSAKNDRFWWSDVSPLAPLKTSLSMRRRHDPFRHGPRSTEGATLPRVNARRRRRAKARRRERRQEALYVAALATLDLDDGYYAGLDYDDEADADATLWFITFDEPA